MLQPTQQPVSGRQYLLRSTAPRTTPLGRTSSAKQPHTLTSPLQPRTLRTQPQQNLLRTVQPTQQPSTLHQGGATPIITYQQQATLHKFTLKQRMQPSNSPQMRITLRPATPTCRPLQRARTLTRPTKTRDPKATPRFLASQRTTIPHQHNRIHALPNRNTLRLLESTASISITPQWRPLRRDG